MPMYCIYISKARCTNRPFLRGERISNTLVYPIRYYRIYSERRLLANRNLRRLWMRRQWQSCMSVLPMPFDLYGLIFSSDSILFRDINPHLPVNPRTLAMLPTPTVFANARADIYAMPAPRRNGPGPAMTSVVPRQNPRSS
jgi:hypothetical protein